MSWIVAHRQRQAPDPDAAPASPGSFARNSLFGTIAGGGAAVGSLLGGIIVAHCLGVEGTGVVAFALFVMMTASTVADLGIQSSLARYLPELIAAGRPREADCLATSLLWVLAVPCGAAFVGFLAYGLWNWRVGGAASQQATIWGLVGVTCVLRTLAGFFQGYLRGLQRFGILARVTAICLPVQLAAIAIGSARFGVVGALAGYCVGNAAPAALWLPQLRYVRGWPSREIWLRVRRYGLYTWAGALASAFVWSRAEVFFLQASSGSAAVALFSIGVTLANVASQGPMLLTSALLPYFAQSFGRGAVGGIRETCATALRVLALLIFPACFGMAAVLPVLVPLLYGRAFSGAVPAATILMAASAVASTASVAGSLIMATDRSDWVFYTGTAAAVLMIVAGFTVIPTFELMGAAWARASIQLLTVGVAAWLIVVRLKIPLPFNDLGRIVVAASLCGGAARTCLWLLGGSMALPLAVITGIVVYIAAIRIMRALPANDLVRLRALSHRLPPWSRRPIDLGLWLISPHPLAAARNAN
jgi:O-antigen/teichoic acid export membrane protein